MTAQGGKGAAGATAAGGGKRAADNGGNKGVDADGHTPLSLLSWLLRQDLKEAVGKGPGAEVFTFGR